MAAKFKYEERPWLKFYLEGGPADADIPHMSLPQVLDEAMENLPSLPPPNIRIVNRLIGTAKHSLYGAR